MTSGKIRFVTIGVFVLTALVIAALVALPENTFEEKKSARSRRGVIVPEFASDADDETDAADYDDGTLSGMLKSAVELEEGEIQLSVFSEDFDRDGAEEQIVAYRNLLEENNPVYITYIDFDGSTKKYTRLWSVPTGITKPGTLSLAMADLTGDHNNNVVVTGMNQKDEQILAVFKVYSLNNADAGTNLRKNALTYREIANIAANGTITIDEKERGQPYQLGFAGGESFNITEHARDFSSGSGMDQIETLWVFNPEKEVYEKQSVRRISGSRIEAARINELLSGGRSGFEQFIDGLWYHVSREGTVDREQYIYFDPDKRDVIFYSDNTQQVYRWQNSYVTRYGIYITSQNISVPTLNRKITVELESLDSVNIKVDEDVRMKIAMNTLWNGSYRKAPRRKTKSAGSTAPFIDAKYNSPQGSIAFSPDGSYSADMNGESKTGRYVFFLLEDDRFLELVPDGSARETYKVLEGKNGGAGILLQPVRLGIDGAGKISDRPVVLSAAGNNGAEY